MIPTPELVTAIQRDRVRAMDAAVLAQRAACYRICCAPTRLDRLALRLGRSSDCQEGTRS